MYEYLRSTCFAWIYRFFCCLRFYLEISAMVLKKLLKLNENVCFCRICYWFIILWKTCWNKGRKIYLYKLSFWFPAMCILDNFNDWSSLEKLLIIFLFAFLNKCQEHIFPYFLYSICISFFSVILFINIIFKQFVFNLNQILNNSSYPRLSLFKKNLMVYFITFWKSTCLSTTVLKAL